LYFEKSSLWDADFLFQLGHHPANKCTNPQCSTKPFTIIHVNGIHIHNLAYCGCSTAGKFGTQFQQLIRRRLFPATTLDPQTACSFLLLRSGQLLSLQSKLSLYDYYICIEKLTDATGTAGVNVSRYSSYSKFIRLTFLKDRYKVFLRTLHMWRHIKMAKRGSRSYDPSGINGTSPGELAALCPACPIPSINLPSNWQSVEKATECVNSSHVFSFSQVLSLSGISITRCLALMPVSDSRGDRFQTTRRIPSWDLGSHTLLRESHIATISSALPISRRFVSFALWYPTLETDVDGKQMSTCSGLTALDHANTKHTKGYATSGIVCTTCRHEFILPEGAGPLQKGKRSVFNSMSFAHATEFYNSYANTDYVVV
jgi:hypothetical protein